MKNYDFLKYSRKVRYIVFFVTIFIMVFSIKVYINNFSIDQEINDLKKQIQQQEQETYFKQNFYKDYLLSDYGLLFSRHEKNFLDENEIIIKIQEKPNQLQSTGDTLEKKDIIRLDSPQKAWDYFIQTKINKIMKNF